MDIKSFIRKMGYTQSIIADMMGISRPTLDLYIEQFESNGYLAKERYNRIFKRLFNDETMSPVVFKRRLESICFIDRDTIAISQRSLNANSFKEASRIHNYIIDDIQEGYNEYI